MIFESLLVLRQIDELTSLLKNAWGNPCIQVLFHTIKQKKKKVKFSLKLLIGYYHDLRFQIKLHSTDINHMELIKLTKHNNQL